MNTSTKPAGYQNRDRSGALFYDAEGAPTLSGKITCGETRQVTLEPAVDKNQRDYLKISGEGVSGALYDNDRKTQPNHPDYAGPIKIGGEDLRISGWKKKIQNGDNAGKDFISIAISDKFKPKQDS